MAKKKLNEIQVADAARLMHVWKDYQAKEKMNQEEVADLLGWLNQSAFSQYINGIIPLNMKAVAAFSRFFEVRAADISPTLAVQMDNTREDRGEYHLPVPRNPVIERIAEDHMAGKLSDNDLDAVGDFAEYRKGKKSRGY